MKHLSNKKVAILAMDGFEQSELEEPMKALKNEGAKTIIVSPSKETHIKGWKNKNWGKSFEVDLHLQDADAEQFDALLLPGGVLNVDQLKLHREAVEFVKDFFETGKPVAAICHGPWICVDADVLEGRMLTSYPAIKNDLTNAGAKWFDKEVVVDEGLVTSRTPDDLAAFNEKMIEEFSEGIHEGQKLSPSRTEIRAGDRV